MYSKILVIATRRIGDVLLTTPFFHALRKAYPEAQIDVVVLKGTGSILVGNNDISNIIETSNKPDWQEYKSILKRIWRKYDLSITTLGGDRPSLYAILGSKNRIGAQHYIVKKNVLKRWLFPKWVKLNDQLWHIVVQNLQFTNLLGIKGSTKVIPPQSTDAKQKLEKLLGFDIENTKYSVIHPYPMWRYKELDDSVWTNISKYFSNNGCKVVISGGPDPSEVSSCEALAGKVNQAINLAGKTQFTDTSKLLKHAQVFVGPDTSITHLAAACGTPTLAIFGPTSPVRWGPWPSNFNAPEGMHSPYEKVKELQHLGNVWLYQPQRQCTPCQESGCEKHLNSKSLCLTEVSSNTLIKLIKSIEASL